MKDQTVEVNGQNFNKEKRSDISYIDPRLIQVKEEFNIRQDYGDLESLKNSIIENGVKQPIRGHRNGDYFEITDGFRRAKAVQMALEEGNEIARVPFVGEKKGYTDEQRIFDMFICNDGKNLTPLEEGEGFKRLENYGYTQVEIAKKLGKHSSHVSQMITLANAPKHIKNDVQNGTISPSTAIQILRQSEDEEEQKQMVEEGKKEAEKSGKNKVSSSNVKGLKNNSPMSKMEDALDQLVEEGVNNEKVELLQKTINTLKNKESTVDKLAELYK